MAEWLANNLVRADDGNIYQKVGQDEFVLYEGAPEQVESSEVQVEEGATESEVSGGDIAKGLAAEIGIASAGQAAGAATGIGYLPIAFSSGVAGSLAAQEIEGREDKSIGRALVAGVVNLMPGSPALKGVTSGTRITGKLVGEAAKAEARRGAAIGASEATAVAIIDNNRLPTVEELATYGGVGGLFGGSIGAVSPKFTKSFKKFLGKGPDEIDNDVATGKIGAEDLQNLNVVDSEAAARKQIENTTQSIQEKQALKTLADALSPDKSFWERTKSVFRPSLVTGREAQDIAFYARNEVRATQELGSKISRTVDNVLKVKPELSDDVNNFLDTGVMTDRLRKNPKIAGDLEVYQTQLKKMQSLLVDQLGMNRFTNMTKADQKRLIQTINESMEADNTKYVSREYELFTNPNFKIDPRKRREATLEIANKIKAESEKNITDAAAYKRAEKQVANLIKSSAKNRQLSENRRFSGSTDSVLKARTNPGTAERAFLGEITNPAERIRGTLDNLGRTVYRNKADIGIASALKKSGLAVNKSPDDSSFTPLKLRGSLETGLFVPNNVQFALDKTYLAGMDKVGEDIIKSSLTDLYDAGIGTSKAVKVILNPPSYAVNAYGGLITMIGSGINPFKGGSYTRGLKYALAEYGKVEDMLSKNSEAGQKALRAAMQDMTKYGITNANVLTSDIRANFNNGFFTDKLSKAFEPIGKAYQATDTAARFSVWANNQQKLSRIFPTLTGDELKLAAAKLTNDTFQNYDKLSNAIRVGSRYGILPQFVSFTAEFMRNIYNQTRYATQMVRGKFGQELGIDMTDADLTAMRNEGILRLTALSTVIAGTEGARQGYNAMQGVDEETEQALRETVVADFDKNKSLLFTVDPETDEVSYVNLSYISPHAMIAEAAQAAFDDRPLESLADQLTSNFMGEGSFVAQSLYQALGNTDANGRPISLEQDKLERFKDQMAYFASEAFKPGVAREADKIIEAATSADPRYSFKDIAARQVGYRVNNIDVDVNAMFKIRDAVGKARQASGKYTSLLRYGSPTQAQAEETYQEAERLRRVNFEKMREHRNNLVRLGKTEEEQIEILKSAGVSSKDILNLLNGTYTPLSKSVELSTSEQYDIIFANKTDSEIRREIGEVRRADPRLAKKFIEEFKKRRRNEQRNLEPRDELIKNLSVDERVDIILANPEKLQEYRRKGIVTKSVMKELRQRGFRE